MPIDRGHYQVPQSILDETRRFLYQRGLLGCEGMALWVGHATEYDILITRVLAPDQICVKTPFGVAVELTEEAHYTLTDYLRGAERLYVRVHSHPGEAYHSRQDDE